MLLDIPSNDVYTNVWNGILISQENKNMGLFVMETYFKVVNGRIFRTIPGVGVILFHHFL